MSRTQLKPTRRAVPSRRVARGRRQVGQSLVIFALVAIVLFGVMGLAVDSSVSYLSGSRVERAAASGAIAGVTYMPAQFANAQTAAKNAAARNGYIDTSLGGNATVTVYQVPEGCGGTSGVACYPNRLGVSVSVAVTNTFTRLLGFPGTHTVLQKATAEYLSTLTLGQPDAHLGGTAADINASPPSAFYFLRSEGWGTPRSEGDAYTPNPASAGSPASTDIHTLNGSGAGSNEVTLPGGWTALPTCGGYSYQVAVPPGMSTAHLQIYNPAFMPNSSNDYRENDSTFTNSTTAQYDTMMYTLMVVHDQFQHNIDTPVSQITVNPVNATNASSASWTDVRTTQPLTAATVTAFYHNWVDVTLPPSAYAGAGTYPATESGGGSLVAANPANAGGALTAATVYRLRVDTLDGTGAGCGASTVAAGAGGGHKGYALRLWDSAASAECTACTVGGINEMAFYTPINVPSGSSHFDIPILSVPAQYAGQTIDIYAFDPGDTSGTNYLSIINPTLPASTSGSPNSDVATDPAGIAIYNLGINKSTPPSVANQLNSGSPGPQPDPLLARVETALNGPHPYNGNWLLFKIPIPTNYAPSGTAQTFWKLRYELSGGTATDTLTVAVGFDGPPVHLIPNLG